MAGGGGEGGKDSTASGYASAGTFVGIGTVLSVLFDWTLDPSPRDA